MVLMRYRRTEHSENAITGRLNDVAVVAADGIDHQFELRIDNCAGLFGLGPPSTPSNL
jgi:hypothetical protein